MRPHTCEKCGHRNFVTREDLDGERARLGDAATERLGQQVRSYDETEGVAALLRRLFFNPK